MLPSREDYVNKPKIAGTFENQVLYRMCLEQPKHGNSYYISGKLIAIGRTYSASIERKAGEPKPGGPTFFEHVSKRFAASKLDALLAKLPNDARIDDKSVLKKVIECHEYLVDLIKESTESWDCKKRNKNWKAAAQKSFASKYLHFHKPNAFPLMDSITNDGLKYEGLKGAYGNYEKLCCKVLAFSNGESKSSYKNKNWTPRSIDIALIASGLEWIIIKEKKKKKKKP